MTGAPRRPFVLAAAVAALVAAMAVQIVRDDRYPLGERETDRFLYVRSGAALKRIALEFDAVAADVYWIRAIQHYGGDRLGFSGAVTRKYDLLYPLLDLTTTLDPYFTIAYRFGAIFLSEGYPGGAGRPDQAVALLRKGIAAQPGKWQYYLDTGFIYYWQLRDFKSAAEWFQRAAQQPNAPEWLAPLSATMLAKGGERAAARFLWRQMLDADQAYLRRNARWRLLQLDALDQIDRLEQAIRRMPPPDDGRYSWRELVRRRIVPGVPVDPTGTPYDIDPVTGVVSVSRRSELFPMPASMR